MCGRRVSPCELTPLARFQPIPSMSGSARCELVTRLPDNGLPAVHDEVHKILRAEFCLVTRRPGGSRVTMNAGRIFFNCPMSAFLVGVRQESGLGAQFRIGNQSQLSALSGCGLPCPGRPGTPTGPRTCEAWARFAMHHCPFYRHQLVSPAPCRATHTPGIGPTVG
jgi:hypothetical protein